jgi:hypothetical protein
VIARSAVRMAVKNRIIVDAIREDRDYDPAAMATVAQRELDSLAAQSEATAPTQSTERYATVYRELAKALLSLSADCDSIEQLVEEAREAAWSEISTVLRSTLDARARDPREDPEYERLRAGRLRQLVSVDLAQLELHKLPEY